MELLEDVVYQTEPMIRARRKNAKEKPLDMDIVNKTKAAGLTVSLEELIERRRQLRAGEVLKHADAMNSLQSAIKSMDAAA